VTGARLKDINDVFDRMKRGQPSLSAVVATTSVVPAGTVAPAWTAATATQAPTANPAAEIATAGRPGSSHRPGPGCGWIYRPAPPHIARSVRRDRSAGPTWVSPLSRCGCGSPSTRYPHPSRRAWAGPGILRPAAIITSISSHTRCARCSNSLRQRVCGRDTARAAYVAASTAPEPFMHRRPFIQRITSALAI